MPRHLLTLICALTTILVATATQATMVDYPLFNVIDGFKQQNGKAEKFGSYTFRTGPKKTDTITVEGPYYELRYVLKKGIEGPGKTYILRNFAEAVRQAGGTVLSESKNESSFTLQQDTKEIWVRVSCPPNGKSYNLHIIERGDLKQEITVNPVQDELDLAGKATVYITFDTDSAVIKAESDDVIAMIVEMLVKRPELSISIEGHTDDSGSPENNLKLSLDRALAVKERLVASGIAATRLSTRGHGQTMPIAGNNTEEGKAKNRRVELVKINK